MKTYKERTESILKKVEQEKKKRAKRGCIVFASVAVAITSINLVLFLPYDNTPVGLEAHKQSEYYSLMNKVNELTYSPPLYKNNFEKWFGDLSFGCGARDTMAGGDALLNGAVPENSLLQSNTDAINNYEEVTNNQTQGVIEGDLFKRSNEYIFYLNYQAGKEETNNNGYSFALLDYKLQAYSINKDKSEEAGSLTIEAEEGMRFNGYVDKAEMYLSQDGKQVTIISPCYDAEKQILYTAVMAFDVTDVSNIKEIGRTYISGSYISSRKVDETLYVVSNYYLKSNPDFNNPEEYLPQMGTRYALNSVKAQDIVWSEEATTAQYTVLCEIDCTTLAMQDSLAFFSYSQEIYASKDNMFVTRSYTDRTEEDGVRTEASKTEVSCINYSGGALSLTGNVTVDGYLNDQYSMDEYDGVLRVFTTHSSRQYKEEIKGEYASMQFVGSSVSASLYCINLQTMQVECSVEKFAPAGETVRSARFDGTKAYVCTAIQVTDPVFAFDLSDLNDITYTDTGVIDGYSISLMKFKDDTLLGIGYNEEFNLKIELYRETTTALLSVTSYEPQNYVTFSQQFKAYFIDTANGYVGLMDGYSGKYILLQFDGYRLVEIAKISFEGNMDRTRAVMVDGWLYVIGDAEMKAVQIL